MKRILIACTVLCLVGPLVGCKSARSAKSVTESVTECTANGREIITSHEKQDIVLKGPDHEPESLKAGDELIPPDCNGNKYAWLWFSVDRGKTETQYEDGPLLFSLFGLDGDPHEHQVAIRNTMVFFVKKNPENLRSLEKLRSMQNWLTSSAQIDHLEYDRTMKRLYELKQTTRFKTILKPKEFYGITKITARKCPSCTPETIIFTP
ncbi:MAG: hypothetical protein NTV34_09090 [Proteobacteria bacterium]|nr:hypothetical protein [Pseudomonadota bacterium]